MHGEGTRSPDVRQAAVPAPGTRRDALDLFAVSFLLLFLELALIRWLPATVRVLADFSNVVLIACFLGMGVGCIYRGRRSLLPTVAPLLLALVAAATALTRPGVAHPYESVEYIFGTSGRFSWLWVLPALFTLVALTFVGIGQRLASLMNRFRPIPGYSINVAGSLLGTVVLAGMAFLRLPPLAWFAPCIPVLLWLMRGRPRALAVSAVAAAFSRTTSPGAALGFNVLGAVAGGLLEHASVLIGIDGLAFLGAALYLAAWATRPRFDATEEVTEVLPDVAK